MTIPDHCPIFTYGTLRKGEAYHGLIGPYVERYCNAELYGMQMYSLGDFPAIVFDETAKKPVKGELVYVIKERWSQVVDNLDRLELEGFLYTRTLVIVMTDKGEPETAWAYVLNQTRLPVRQNRKIESNDWKNRGSENASIIGDYSERKSATLTSLLGAIAHARHKPV